MLLTQGGLLFGLDVGDELARFDRDRGFGFFHGGKFGQLASSRRIEFFDREQALLLAHGRFGFAHKKSLGSQGVQLFSLGKARRLRRRFAGEHDRRDR